MTKKTFLYVGLFLTAFLAGNTSITKCFAQAQNIAETLNIFSDNDNQKKIPAKSNQKAKSISPEKQAPVGNCGKGEWAQCDYDGINN